LSLYFASFSVFRRAIDSSNLRGKGGMKFGKLRLIQDGSPRPAAENMAIDETLFLNAAYPVLRSYRWVRPSVSFGYFTPWNEVVLRFAGRDLVRRWTGGGIVEHGQDFTYSLICPGNESLPTTIEFYRLVHLAISNILQKNGCPVEMVPFSEPVWSTACFEKAVQFDLKLRDEKIAGAAIRRNRRGLLLQGSIQRLEVPAQFAVMLAGALGEQVDCSAVSDLLMEQAAHLVKEKYGAAEWNCRR
jgi:lipoyl(octanoyl) transferase